MLILTDPFHIYLSTQKWVFDNKNGSVTLQRIPAQKMREMQHFSSDILLRQISLPNREES